MPPVRSALHLVAQRQALMNLKDRDASYAPLLEGWLDMLNPTERQVLRFHDNLVSVYMASAPAPVHMVH